MKYNIIKEEENGSNILFSLYIDSKLILKGYGLMYEKELNRFSFYRYKAEYIRDNYHSITSRNSGIKIAPLQMYYYPEESELFFISKRGKSIFVKININEDINYFLQNETYLLYDYGKYETRESILNRKRFIIEKEEKNLKILFLDI